MERRTTARSYRLSKLITALAKMSRMAQPDMVRAVKFGEGFIDYEAFFRGLREGGFDGIANYEMCSPIRGGGQLENLDAYATQYVEWMRSNVQF